MCCTLELAARSKALGSSQTVLIADNIDKCALELLRQHGLETKIAAGASYEELLALVADADALVVRSRVPVTREMIAGARRLKVIARAGIGVDNIDLEAATERGIWVVNAPNSNAVAVAEHTIGLMLCLARRTPWAWESLRRGQWQREHFRGQQLHGKTLGIVGLGRIGSRVAERARCFGMKVIAHDPFVAPERASAVGATLVPLEELLRRADFISLHVPATPSTIGLLGVEELRLCKPTAFLINCARGAVVDEQALLEALDAGRLAGAALDVFSREPPLGSALVCHPLVIATPHIGGLTAEAQEDIALTVAQQILDVLDGRNPEHPVNAPALSPEERERLAPYTELARRMGLFYAGIAEEPTERLELGLLGEATGLRADVLEAAALEGLLSGSEVPVNLINARRMALARGISISHTLSPTAPSPYASALALSVSTPSGTRLLLGTTAHGQPYIVRIDDLQISFVPAGLLLYTEHIEQPGILGRMGTLLGEHGVNISFVQVGRQERGGPGIMILGVDDELSEALLGAIERMPSVRRARLLRLPPLRS